jgi:hypothetical protein
MAAKKATKKVTLSIDRKTLERLIDALHDLGVAQGFEEFVDDPDTARQLKARGKKR